MFSSVIEVCFHVYRHNVMFSPNPFTNTTVHFWATMIEVHHFSMLDKPIFAGLEIVLMTPSN